MYFVTSSPVLPNVVMDVCKLIQANVVLNIRTSVVQFYVAVDAIGLRLSKAVCSS